MAQNMRNIDEARRTDSPNLPRTGAQVEETAVSAIEKGKQKAGEWGQQASQAAGDLASRAQEMSTAAYETVRDKTGELTQAAAQQAEQLGREMTALIRRYPLQSLATGIALGFLLGKVIDLRRS